MCLIWEGGVWDFQKILNLSLKNGKISAMGIEWVRYSRSLAFAAGPAAENFRIDANLRQKPPELFLSPEQVKEEAASLLTKPPWRRTFLIGPFTGKIDSVSGVLRDNDRELVEATHQFYEELGVECYSSFKREDYGRKGIRDEDATLLDMLAIRTSHVLTVLPDSSQSNGVWEEIRYGGSLRKSFLFLFRRRQEVEFKRSLRSLIANLSTHPFLVFITFDSLPELFDNMNKVWSYVSKESTEDRDWHEYVESLLTESEFKRLQDV